MQRQHLEEHEASCKHRLEACEACEQGVPFHNMKQHLKGCDHVEVDCACGAKIERRLMHTHGENVCPEATVDCPYNTHGCDADVLRKDLDDHMSEEGGAHAQLLAAELSATQSKLDATNSMLEATKTKLNGTQSKLDETTANLGMRLAALERQSTAARKNRFNPFQRHY